MGKIVIPDRLESILTPTSGLGGSIYNSLEPLQKWIESGGLQLPFFPEYTDHGLDHISNVLATIVSLVPKETWPLLTQEDAAVVILATVLHDCAMHISEDGFLHLLQSSSDYPTMTEFGEVSWFEEWEEFFSEARRWDGQALKRLLGDTGGTVRSSTDDHDDLVKYVRRPSEMGDPDRWPSKYRKFIGEFLRKHHGRLAHDIAVLGVPGPHSKKLRLQGVPMEIADLAGLVARSHSMQLRDTFGYLKTKYHGRVICRNVHPVYLMTLLRIADYLDMEADRAPPEILAVRRLRSPLSLGEWGAHAAVVEVRPDEQDKEAIFVLAEPKDAKSFLKIGKLLRSLQFELDVSWAVLGEVYSKQDDLGLHKLGITLRRVRSNLDDLDEFADSVDYIPVAAAFSAAGGDLLKLLIEPLYGDNPAVGIRELMQNALDAVRERREYYVQANRHSSEISWPALDHDYPDADIIVSVCERPKGCQPDKRDPIGWTHWVEVADRGIGMSPETVTNYFLKAGATFRNSDAWRMKFTDDHTRSKVLRSGRFGIGVLAAFLLGDTIRVSTRHLESNHAVRFEAVVDDTDIDLLKDERQDVGTTIQVRIDADTYRRLTHGKGKASWDWYCAGYPKVIRIIKPKGDILRQSFQVPSPMSPPRRGWRVAPHSRYWQVYWTYGEHGPKLCCNGILIQPRYYSRLFEAPIDPLISVQIPKFSVFDGDGMLPLNILRNELQPDLLAYDDEITADIVRDFFAYTIVTAPKIRFYPHGDNSEYTEIDYPGFRETPSNAITDRVCPWISLKDGTVYFHPWHICRSGVDRLIFCFLRHNASGFGWDGLPLGKLDYMKTGVVIVRGDAKGFIEKSIHGWLMTSSIQELIPIKGMRTLVSNDYLAHLTSPPHMDAPSTKVKTRRRYNSWTLFEQGKILSMRSDVARTVAMKSCPKGSPSARFVIEVFIDEQRPLSKKSLLTSLWEKMKMPAVIPFEPDQRKRALGRHYNRLSEYVELWATDRRM